MKYIHSPSGCVGSDSYRPVFNFDDGAAAFPLFLEDRKPRPFIESLLSLAMHLSYTGTGTEIAPPRGPEV